MVMTIGDVARLAGVSVRTLHHYDEVGLLSPSGRSEAGYRLYADGDLERLQQVLFYKELGFGLDEIQDLMNDPGYDSLTALAQQREMLGDQLKRTEAMIALIDKTMMSIEGAIPMEKDEMFEVFGDFDPAEYEDEVKERWGDTEAYRESAKRTARYKKEDWQRMKDEGAEIMERMIALFDSGAATDSDEAMDVAEESRLQIDKWFYPCSRQMHAALGEMYVADPRFKQNYDQHREGLAEWFRDAIRANRGRGE